MRELYITDEKSLREMIGRWLDGSDVIAPRRMPQGDVFFEGLEDPRQCELDFEIQACPPKEVLLPGLETLFVYRFGEHFRLREVFDARPRLLFGVRPCDMCATNMLREFAAAPPADPYITARIEATTCIVMACPRVFDNHFCDLTRTGPALKEGFDWQVTPLGDDFAIEVGGERGRGLLSGVEDLVSPADAAESGELSRIHAAALESGTGRPDLMKDLEKKGLRGVRQSVWEELALHCRSCGGCSFVCPTCWCFDIADVPTGPAAGLRQRRWDSCAYREFAQMARGQVPYAQKSSRIRMRLLHKFEGLQSPPSRPLCVGCGRCVAACFGDIDLREVIEDVFGAGDEK